MKKGFTLSEVLITLGIIGVVAAITLPSLVANYQKNVLTKQFLKAYNILQNGLLKTESDLGYIPECYYCDEVDGCLRTGPTYENECRVLLSQLRKNLSVIKECKGNALKNGCIPAYKGNDEIFQAENPDATDEEIQDSIRGCNGFSKTAIHNDNNVWILSDGTILTWYNSETKWPLFLIDVNGQKGPNKWGYDVFPFEIYSNTGKNITVKGVTCGRNIEKGGVSTSQMIINAYK